MYLDDAEPGCLGKDTQPGAGVELGRALVELDGIRAIGAMQRTSMRELGKHSDGCCDSCHNSRTRFAARPLRNSRTSHATSLRSALKLRARSSMMASSVALPSQRLRISRAI